MKKENEGGTSYDGKAAAYSTIGRQQRDGCNGFHRGDLVYIAEKPGTRTYRVLAVDTSRSTAMICSVGDVLEAWTVPLALLSKIQ